MFITLFFITTFLINLYWIKFDEDFILNISIILFIIIVYICCRDLIKIFKFFNIFRVYFIYRILIKFNFYYIKEYLYLLFIKNMNLIYLKYKWEFLYKKILNKLNKLCYDLQYICIYYILLKINISFENINQFILEYLEDKNNDSILFF